MTPEADIAVEVASAEISVEQLDSLVGIELVDAAIAVEQDDLVVEISNESPAVNVELDSGEVQVELGGPAGRPGPSGIVSPKVIHAGQRIDVPADSRLLARGTIKIEAGGVLALGANADLVFV